MTPPALFNYLPCVVTDRGTGNSTYAGAFAAVMANVVLIGYVIVAFQDDKAEREELDEKERKKMR